ncbi:TVP38/TMEM64 family protein [Virgibacillus sp. NKC19-16]|uniref:TVP38/TMEM64 family protein n=1 Tax=Virgibacillus salidurans TaxID=2831673 RepID=UPI001F2CB586|nr:TVP38/TMEM64 family protein [Virgibacillus sp. NKC19-16]UJL47378.1 TVP38/TMEM64 family protein [Virgibacillus sp. NKC19-16]
MKTGVGMTHLKKTLINYQKPIVRITSIVGIILLIGIAFLIFESGFFNNPDRVQNWVEGFGSIAPLAFLGLTYVQVVIPVLPGNVSTVVGVMLFGIGLGSVLNIVGIFIGSLTNFLLARRFGRGFASYFVKQETYDKYIGWVNKGKRFERFFWISLVFPGFPDDFICLIAGLTKMPLKKFVFYFLLCKPITLFIYTLFAIYGMQFFYDLIQSI